MSYTLAQVILEGADSAKPAPGEPGRHYSATDTKKLYRDTGTTWDDVTPGVPAATLSAAPSAPGNFSIAHGLSFTPTRIAILATSAGAIWAQATFADSTNINLTASDSGVTAKIHVFA